MGATLALTTASPDFFIPGDVVVKKCIHKYTMVVNAIHIRPILILVDLARVPIDVDACKDAGHLQQYPSSNRVSRPFTA